MEKTTKWSDITAEGTALGTGIPQDPVTLKGSHNITKENIMPQSLSKIYVHIIFSTKDRYPFLSDTVVKQEMHAYIGGTLNNLGCPVICVGGVADHVHILSLLSRNHWIAKVVEEIKKGSSKWIKTKGDLVRKFAWQRGYAAFSVSQSHITRVQNYIFSKEVHHKRKTFQDEFREFLKRYEVEYDEHYVWD